MLSRAGGFGVVAAVGLAAVALAAAGPAAAADQSSFLSQAVPSSMQAGTTATVSLTFMNTGTNPWTVHGGYVLACPSAIVASNWEVSTVALPSPVDAGSSATFSFRVTAPQTPGAYRFQWQLRRASEFFGALSPSVSIRVFDRSTASN